MLRAAELPVSSLNTPVGLGPFCRYSCDLDVSEERSSDDHYNSLAPSLKPLAAGARSVGGALSSACRGVARSSSAACAPWVPAFLAATYFQPCDRHRHHKKNECTFFCVTCGLTEQSVCQHCMGAHVGHQVIQVRRYVYCDVVRSCDINGYVDTTGVQNYIINSAKVMFLNHRPHSKIGRANGVDICRTCQRHLREGYSYCSLACKVEALTKGESCVPAGAASPSPLAAAAATAGSIPPAFAPAGGVSPSGGRPFRMEGLAGAAAASSGGATGVVGRNPRGATPRIRSSYTGMTPPSPRSSSGGGGGGGFGFRSPALPDYAAAAAVVASWGGVGGGLSSDPESSEPGEEVVLYGSASRACGMYGYRAGGPAARAGAPARRSAGGSREREVSGSASSDDDCCDLNFENPPKRRRSCLMGRRLSGGVGCSDPPPPSTAAADAAAAATAAATLLIPFRSTSGALSLERGRSLSACGMVPEPPAPAAAAAAAVAGGFCDTLRNASSLTLSAGASANLSRRKQTAPQRAPSC